MKKTKDSFLNNKVMQAIREWVKSHDDRAIFFGGFTAFDKEWKVTETRMICYGGKSSLQIFVNAFLREFNKEEESFVNWHEAVTESQ